ncbi:unnamed protein product [Pleuronectes platessa]|uniref:Uncharacterized protein n=1 Tax=Pleuronectes platessa TaxID=8262 RepID=A0A9N7U3F7_PLEPL|nr:unnamed protein product [Pleuronectes platessa]
MTLIWGAGEDRLGSDSRLQISITGRDVPSCYASGCFLSPRRPRCVGTPVARTVSGSWAQLERDRSLGCVCAVQTSDYPTGPCPPAFTAMGPVHLTALLARSSPRACTDSGRARNCPRVGRRATAGVAPPDGLPQGAALDCIFSLPGAHEGRTARQGGECLVN